MKALAIALLLTLATPAFAVDIAKVTTVDDGLLDQFMHAPTPDVRDLIRDTTMLIKLGDLDPKLLAALPFGTDAVLYFAEDGDLLVWSDKSGTVEQGYWEVVANAGFNEFCIRFGSFGLNSVCASPEIATSDWPQQITGGNPFGLKAGAPVPATLGRLGLAETAAALP